MQTSSVEGQWRQRMEESNCIRCKCISVSAPADWLDSDLPLVEHVVPLDAKRRLLYLKSKLGQSLKLSNN